MATRTSSAAATGPSPSCPGPWPGGESTATGDRRSARSPSMSHRLLAPLTAAVLGLAALAAAADVVVVEDWSKVPVGTKGIPPGWEKQRWGSPSYDFTVEEDEGHRVLHLKSAGDSSNI